MIFDAAVTDDFVLFTVIYVQGEEGREGGGFFDVRPSAPKVARAGNVVIHVGCSRVIS